MFREYVNIVENRRIGGEHYLMRIRASKVAPKWVPGQFLNVLPPVHADTPPLLRRPFSILGSSDDIVDFVYRVVGTGTKILSELTEGTTLDIIGPLGHGFIEIPSSKGRHILIAGGVGVPPLIALSRVLLAQKIDVEFFFGAKDRETLILHDTLSEMSFKYHFATEDGSIGNKGFISEILPASNDDIACVYACGPIEMLKAIYKWRGSASFKYYASIENKMACGVGVCLGCSVPTVKGDYALACTDGPVFDADLLDWARL